MKTFISVRGLQHSLRMLICLVTASLLITSCKHKRKLIVVDPEYSKYVDGYTSGIISKKNTIRIQLASEVTVVHSDNETVKEDLFSFTPSVKGKAIWLDARTIEFKPESDLKSDELYEVDFSLGKIMNVPSKFGMFKFNVQTIKPGFEVEENGLRCKGKELMNLSGQIQTADVTTGKDIEKVLKATYNGRPATIKWQHNETNKTHGFIIEDIIRGSTGGTLTLNWDGAEIGVKNKDSKTLSVPAIGDYKVMEVRTIQDQEQYALVQFSEPIQNPQQLAGLITMSNQEELSYTIIGSEVKVYAQNRLEGSYTVKVNEGIQDEWGNKLSASFTASAFFENRLPSLKIHGKGVILPNSGGKVILPFEATNLKAVDISIVKIYENNIPQFLQRNDLDGSDELRRVGTPLVQTTLKLDNDKSLNLHKKNRFMLDLDKYIKTEPGAIYRVHIGFRPDYSLYACKEMVKASIDEMDNDYEYEYQGRNRGAVDDEEEFWSRYDSYYPYGYNWEQRDNPCNQAYYNRERFDSRNIIATNIGLTAKKGNDNQLFVAVNNLITTEPMNGVNLQVLDYQMQLIGKGVSADDGTALIPFKRKPFLLVAKNGNEKSYLKLEDGSSLALSRFEVGGEEIKNGIKGFIFGERGVWRPGDSLFLSCIIEDKDNKLPAGHPVEMSLMSPKGQLYKRLVKPNAEDGFNVFRTATDQGAPTGNWLCRVKVGGATFEKKLKIETVMPNRLKIDLDFGGLKALGNGANLNGTLTAKWLFGATAQSLKARVDAQLYRKTTSFENYKDYEFDNPTSSFAAQSKTVFDGSLSADGKATINPQFDVGKDAPGMLLANLMIKVFEPGGNFSTDNISLPYHPFSSYAGVKVPEGDKQWGYLISGQYHEFGLVDVNTNGVPVSGATNMEVQLFKIQWRWWWDNSGDELSNFTQDNYNKLISKDNVVIHNGKGTYKVKINDDEWGRYLMLVKDTRSGHVTGKTFYVDNNNWQSRATGSDASAAAMLSFTADKNRYNVGDMVNLTIPSSEHGRILISLETGSKVLKHFWVDAKQKETKYSFRVEKEMSPNIYVNVSLIQPHAQTLNDLPIRMYGVIPLMVDDRNTILKPVLKMEDVIKPESATSVIVSETNGKNMSYVIAVVDEGLLDLTHFKTPDPHDAFYAKEALGVKSWDVYDNVIGAWGGTLERILTIGGDGEAELASKTRRANRFKPIVQFMGPFKSNGSSKTHRFTLPAYMGSVRVMVIACNGTGAYGMTDKSVKVKKPLMLLATLPRVLGPGEDFKIPVTVFATENNIKKVNVSIQSNPFIQSEGTTVMNFDKPGEQLIYFNAKVKTATGIGKVKVVATSGKEQTAYEVELDIRNPNSFITQVTEATLQPGQSWTGNLAMIGEGKTSKATVELSSIPAISLEKRLSYLIHYPHGCIEQTTSSVFPQLVLHQLTELSDEKKAEIDRNIKAGILRIQNFQQSDGGFSYWPGGSVSDDWGSSYAGHFLLEASARGYNIPSSLLQQWKNYQRNKALAWNVTEAPWYGTDLVQAYRLYLLALAKSPEIGAMNRLKEYKFLTAEAKWRLAAAYYLAGQSGIALNMVSGLPLTFISRPYPGITYGSDVRDDAMVLEALTVMNRKAEAEQLVRTIASKLSQDTWYSTQTTAYGLIALANYSGNNKDGKLINASLKNGKQSLSINSKSSISQTKLEWQNGKSAIQLKNTGNSVLYVRVINEGQPILNQVTTYKNNPNILEVSASYFTTSGAPIDVSKIKQGTDFVAKVVVKNPGARGVYHGMALTQIFPSGWEILNTRLYNSEGMFKSSASDYMDIRDDRVNIYFDLDRGQTLTYYVQLNAAYLGKYYWPGVYCEAMYDNTISGGVNGKWVAVE